MNDALTGPVRFSHLKHMHASPLHYRHNLLAPRETTAAMRIGKAVHKKLLGGEPYQVFRGERRGAKWDDFKLQYAGMEILSEKEESTARAIADSVLANPDAFALLKRTEHEKEIDWTWCGRACRSHLDMLATDVIAELKVGATSDPRQFWRHATKQLWHAQLAFYDLATGGWRWGQPKREYLFIAAESKPPYPVTVFRLSDSDRVNGEKLCRTWMERLLQCEADDHWPGYAERIIDLTPPEWSVDVSDEGEETEE